MTSLAIAIGGALGALARHGASAWLSAGSPLLATFAINMAGSLLLGLLVGWLPARRAPLAVQLGFTVGVCGGFTTFSTFAFEMADLLQRGQVWAPVMLMGLSLVLGPLVMMAGLWISGALPLPHHDGRTS